MFFPERIRSIRPADRVLEVGPGGTPHPRSDVLLEYRFESPEQAEGQRGYAPPLQTTKPVVFYEGARMPFADGEFDYVICSHVVEHVPDVTAFVGELCRVARGGYLEYPTVYYDYVYNFPEHVSFVKRGGDRLYWMPKSESRLALFQPVQDLFYRSLVRHHYALIEDLKPFFFEGFEWAGQLETVRTTRLEDLVFPDPAIPTLTPGGASLPARLAGRLRRWRPSRGGPA